MHCERRNEQLAVTDLIGNEGAEENNDAETGGPSAGDRAEVGLGEMELSAPVAENATSRAESYAGGEDGHEAGEEEAFRVGCRRAGVVLARGNICGGGHGWVRNESRCTGWVSKCGNEGSVGWG